MQSLGQIFSNVMCLDSCSIIFGLAQAPITVKDIMKNRFHLIYFCREIVLYTTVLVGVTATLTSNTRSANLAKCQEDLEICQGKLQTLAFSFKSGDDKLHTEIEGILKKI